MKLEIRLRAVSIREPVPVITKIVPAKNKPMITIPINFRGTRPININRKQVAHSNKAVETLVRAIQAETTMILPAIGTTSLN